MTASVNYYHRIVLHSNLFEYFI